MIRIYSLPDGTFSTDEDEDEEEEDEDEDDEGMMIALPVLSVFETRDRKPITLL